jgi:hypothetical protein
MISVGTGEPSFGFSREVSTTVTEDPSGSRLSGSTKNRRPQLEHFPAEQKLPLTSDLAVTI